MKRLLIVLFLLIVWSYAQCLASPIGTRVGIKFGINPGFYNADDNGDKFSGTGTHIGFGMGTDILKLISIDMMAQLRSTNYSRDEFLEYRTYSYSNLYFPLFVSIKAGMLPLVSPYLGIGVGINVRFNAKEKFRFNSTTIENEIEGGTQGFLILGLGAEIKLLKFRISPEFTANINGNADDPNTENRKEENIDYHISLGFYYAP